MALKRALAAEFLKLKRTLAFWLAPIAPLVIVALQEAVVLQRQSYYRQQVQSNAWEPYTQQTVFLWTVLMLPLFITLETALLAHLEHGNQQWKHLFALPVARGAMYAAKEVTALLLIGLSMGSLYVLLVAGGLGLRILAPGLGFEPPVPWMVILRYVGPAYLASWLIISLHTWIAVRSRSFVVASAVGIVAMMIAVVVVQSDWGAWYPWTLAGLTASGVEGLNPVPLVLAGSLGGVLVAFVGGWDVTRRDA